MTNSTGNDESAKQPYRKPVFRIYGTVEELTRSGGSAGNPANDTDFCISVPTYPGCRTS